MERIFGSEMLEITFVFLVLEILMFFYQFIHYLSRPEEKKRLYYLILLFLLIFYNITGGLFPDPDIHLPIVLQNSLAYGSGFLMASYFPYYFYKGFDLEHLKFHAYYGVWLFLLLPYLIFFVIVYGWSQNLRLAIDYGIIVPFFYSIVVLSAILKAIRAKHNQDKNKENWIEVIAVYAAVIPWVSMTPIAYFNLGQFVEVICTNGGFVAITVFFIYQSIQKARLEYQLLIQLKGSDHSPSVFLRNCECCGLTNRELEIIQLIRKGMKYQLIAERLFISEFTVKKHVNNMFEKTTTNNKMELIHKLDSLLEISSKTA